MDIQAAIECRSNRFGRDSQGVRADLNAVAQAPLLSIVGKEKSVKLQPSLNSSLKRSKRVLTAMDRGSHHRPFQRHTTTDVKKLEMLNEITKDLTENRAYGTIEVPTSTGLELVPARFRTVNYSRMMDHYFANCDPSMLVSRSVAMNFVKMTTAGYRMERRCLDNIKENQGRRNWDDLRSVVNEMRDKAILVKEVNKILKKIFTH